MMMKRLFFVFAFVLAAGFTASGDNEVERIYVSTDREVYVAGEPVFCSLFCLDVSGTPRYSSLSSVAYLELSAPGIRGVQARIALIAGRGSGLIMLPSTLPTGNYRLYAYTTQNRNEEGTGYLSASRILSVYNTQSSDRVKGGVIVVPEDGFASTPEKEKELSGSLRLSFKRSAAVNGVLPVILDNSEGKAASLSVSVFKEDDISPAEVNGGMASFLRNLPDSGSVSFRGGFTPDSDGEILYARLSGTDWQSIASEVGITAFISSSGAESDIYSSTVSPDGSMVFNTNNIYGHREIVCEVVGADEGLQGHMVLKSPFIGMDAEPVPPLKLSTALRSSLRERHRALRTSSRMNLDTLFEFLPVRPNLLLSAGECKRYHLDDYTRFPTMEELVVEIIPEVRLAGSKRKDTRYFTILMGDSAGKIWSFRGNVLVLMDGVPMSDQKRLIDFDAMLISDVEVYQRPYLLGQRVFNGVINFVTTKNSITALRFSDKTRVVDFEGASYPVALTRPVSGAEDLRQTLYWHPQISVEAGEERRIEVRTPSYPGVFRVVVEGLDSEGNPVYSTSSFEVR